MCPDGGFSVFTRINCITAGKRIACETNFMHSTVSGIIIFRETTFAVGQNFVYMSDSGINKLILHAKSL